jgi:aminopeptidase 2
MINYFLTLPKIFDALSYSKAASGTVTACSWRPLFHSCYEVLRMLANYVGEEKFLRGVSIYLKKKLYGNSVTKDLWEGISVATGMLSVLHVSFFFLQ